jgi:transcriptional regulator with XRE-family HTH domain
MARAALDWTVRDLAEASGLHRNTITNIEIGRFAGDLGSIAAIERVLTAAGIEFLDENDGGAGVRFRRRARPKGREGSGRTMSSGLQNTIPYVLQSGPRLSMQKVSIRQVKAARALLDWSQERLAGAADVSIPTIKRLEASDGPLGGRSETGEKIRTALEQAGVEFIDANGGGPGVRLRKSPQVSKRK